MSELEYFDVDQPGEQKQPEIPKGALSRLDAGQSMISPQKGFVDNTLDVWRNVYQGLTGGPTQYKDVEASSHDFMLKNGVPEPQASQRAKEIGNRAYRGEWMQNALFALPMVIGAPAIGAFKTYVSQPLESSTGFPAEATEGFTMAALAAFGMRSHAFGRLKQMPDGKMQEQIVGGLPKPEDFKNTATVVTQNEVAPHVEAKLNQLWQEKGIHPAEVLDDAARDPVVKQQLFSTTGGLPETYGLTNGQVIPDWENWEKDTKGAIATRVLDLGNGEKAVVPAPEEIASHLQEFGRQAGFRFQVGPLKTERRSLEAGPAFHTLEYRYPDGQVKFQSHVYIPDNPDYQLRNWYGIGRSEVLYHEVGHALDFYVINRGTGMMNVIKDPALLAEMKEAQMRFSPKLTKEHPEYKAKQSELMADSIAAWLSDPTIRKEMPLFTAKYGRLLDKYRKIAERALPKRTEGGDWEMPPGGESEAGAGGGGRGGAGGPPDRINGGDDGMPPGPPGWFEFPGPEEPRPNVAAIQDSILKDISIGQKTDKKTNWSFDKLYTDFVDRFFPVAQEVKHVPEEVRPESAIDDPYKRARLFAGVAGKADHFIEYGSFDWHTFENTGRGLRSILEPVKDDMRGFTAFVAALRDIELDHRGIPRALNSTEFKDVMTYAKENMGKYRQVALELIHYQNRLAEYLKDSGVLNDRAYAEMLEANKLYVPFHRVIGDDAFAQRLGMGGSLTPHNPIREIKGSELKLIDPVESIIKNTYLLTAMAEKNAVGTKLVDMLLEARAHEARQGRKIEISETPTLPPPNANAVGEWLGEQGAKGEGLRDALAEATRSSERSDEISIFRNGKRTSYRVSEELARSWKNLDASTAGWLENMMKPFTSALRAGAVLNPEFMARHTFRDFIYAFVTTTKGVFTPIDMAKGFIGLARKDNDFQNWLKGGGGQVTIASLDRSWLQEKLADLTDKTGVWTRAYNVVIDPEATWLMKGKAVLGMPVQAVSKYVIHPLQVGTEFALSASHLASYKKAMRSIEKERRADIQPPTTPNLPAPFQMGGLPAKNEYTLGPSASLKDAIKLDSAGKHSIIEAAWQSRETSIDGQRMGAKMRAYNAISAFANAKVQDTDRVVRLLKDHPVSGTMALMAGITLPSLMLWTVNHDDSRYQELPDWEKDAFWIIPTDKWEPVDPNDHAALNAAAARPKDQVRLINGRLNVNNGHVFRVPKPFGAGVVFGSLPERLLDKWVASKPEAMQGFAHSLMEATAGDLMPNALAPVMNQLGNRTSFSNRTLIPAQLEKELPEYQYLPYTSETAKALGRIISAFPGIRSEAVEGTGVGRGAARAATSPILIENYVREWTGGLGMYALQLSDKSLQAAGVLPSTPHAPSTLADIPVVKAFVARYPSMNAQSIQDFYDQYQAGKTYFDTWQAKAKEGDVEAMSRIAEMGGNQMFSNLDSIHKVLGEHIKLIRQIDKDPSIKDYEKRQQIDSLYFQAINMAQLGVKTLAAMPKKD